MVDKRSGCASPDAAMENLLYVPQAFQPRKIKETGMIIIAVERPTARATGLA